MNRTRVLFALCALCMLCRQASLPQGVQLVPGGESVLSGFQKALTGETIAYHSFHPFAREALLTRTTTGEMKISWETQTLSGSSGSDTAYFVWIAGHSSGTSTGDRTFFLSVNDEQWFTFRTVAAQRVNRWSVDGLEGSALSFQSVWEDQVHDLFGYMVLKVPARILPPGRPLRITVAGEKAGASDWYMAFTYSMRESVQVRSQPAVVRDGQKLRQLIDITIDHVSSGGTVEVEPEGYPSFSRPLALGLNHVELPIDTVTRPRTMTIDLRISGMPLRREAVMVRPVRKMEFYFLPHSHNDIGYSDLQPDVEKKQLKNLHDAVELAQKTAAYPRGARFKWNTEILWAVESYLTTAGDAEKQAFIRAVRDTSIGLQALFDNALTGISRPEELFRLTDYARKLSREYGLPINSAMVSDVPGFSLGIVPALALSGVKYFSSGPNYIPGSAEGGDRVGHSNNAWGDRPFYWVSPSGQEKVLFWMAGKGYSWFHDWIGGKATENTRERLFGYLQELESRGYPYDMVQLRYTIVGDNGPTDPGLPDFVKQWNEHYAWPRIVIATSSEMFEEFERRYQGVIPVFSGDLTPYWEDGALSSAYESGCVERAKEKLIQAELLAAMHGSRNYDPEKFYAAWRNVLLFDEHTWGAYNSISEPDNPFAVTQWNIKRQFALAADSQSTGLLNACLGKSAPTGPEGGVRVVNTQSWPRTDVVVLPAEMTGEWKGVAGSTPTGSRVISQRLSTGELAFLAEDVPPLGEKGYGPGTGKSDRGGETVQVGRNTISNGIVELTIDTATGSIASFRLKKSGLELVDRTRLSGLNDYLYVPGKDPDRAEKSTAMRISVKERGPVRGSLLIESEAPGCTRLTREVCLSAGTDRLEIIDTIDKRKVREKEAVHIGFPLAVQDGVMRMDLGWGSIRPQLDQLPGSCKDYISAQRWVDISNQDYGITWSTDFLGLVEVGKMTSEMPGPDGHRPWQNRVEPSGTLYSYVMNNYWHTNYKADQEGPVVIRYYLRPHGMFTPLEAYRFGIECNQPLLSEWAGSLTGSMLTLLSPGIVITSMRPSRDGKAVMIRFFNAGASPDSLAIRWGAFTPNAVSLSSDSEEEGKRFVPPFLLPAEGILMLRCER